MVAREIAVKKYVVKLSADEREQWESLIHGGKHPAQKLTKARILLKVDASPAGEAWSGLPPEEWRGEIRALRGKPGDPFHGHPCLDRCSIVESGMKTLPIVEHLDIIEHRRFRLFAGAEAAVVDVL